MVEFSRKKLWFGAFLLSISNIVVCMDRSTLSGLIKDIQAFYDIRDGKGGALQSIVAVTLSATTPIFGYIGDRFNRKAMVVLGLFFTMASVALGPFMPTFTAFMVCRAAVGIGMACVGSVASVMISDMFASSSRSLAIAMYFMALPVGYGLGFISGQGLATITGHWRNAFLSTGAIGSVITIFIIFFVQDPSRGSSDGQDHLPPSSYLEDLKSFATNKSLILVVLSDSCVAFGCLLHHRVHSLGCQIYSNHCHQHGVFCFGSERSSSTVRISHSVGRSCWSSHWRMPQRSFEKEVSTG